MPERFVDAVSMNSPLREIRLWVDGVPRSAWLKLESSNPTGSSKDRTAEGLIADLLAQDRRPREPTVVESTSGNLGIALARVTAREGLNFVAVVDPRTTGQVLSTLQSYRAEVKMVKNADSFGSFLPARLALAEELARVNPRAVWVNQYVNPANPLAHYWGTGQEILSQTNGVIDALYAPVSTGGTLAGAARAIRERRPSVRIVAVDARGSVALGGTPGPRLLTGIGSSRPSSHLGRQDVDEVYRVRDEDAFAYCRALKAATGLILGGSTGAVLAACASDLAMHPDLKCPVCICADSGDRYAETIYDDQWLAAQGIDLPSLARVGFKTDSALPRNGE